jgi:hypothetical protein
LAQGRYKTGKQQTQDSRRPERDDGHNRLVAFGAESLRRKAGFSPTDKITAIGCGVLGAVKKPDGGIWWQEAVFII